MTKVRKRTGLLIQGNSKLGNDIWHFSIPAVATCPGRSTSCESLCYAKKGLYAMPSVKQSAERRDAARKKPSFVREIINEITAKQINLVRIHVSGDFDSPAYVRKWQRIVKALPLVKFYFYTRSWRVNDIWPEIQKLANYSNVNAWLSCDNVTGQPPVNSKFAVAYMALNDQDIPTYATDMVFRVSRTTKAARWPNLSVVCPVERTPSGTVNHAKLNCSTCKLCHGDKFVWLQDFRNNGEKVCQNV